MARALFAAHDTSTAEGRTRERYRRVALSVASGIGGRALATAASLVTTPLLLGHLGKDRFGLYSAVMATVAWLSLLEMGMASGLVNVVAEASGRGDRRAAASYVATAFALLVVASVAAGALFAAAAGELPWQTIFGAVGRVPAGEVHAAAVAAVATFLMALPFAVAGPAQAGFQRSYVGNIFAMISAAGILLAVWLAARLGATLPGLIWAVGATTAAVGMASLAALLRAERWPLRTFLARVSRRAWTRLSRTAIPLFLFQIGALMVNQSQLLILSHTSTLATTADYAIIVRIVQIFSGVILLATGAFFPAYREAIERGDHGWVQGGFRRMLVLRMVMAGVFAAGLILAGNDLLKLWLRLDDVEFAPAVWMVLATYLLTSAWVSAHSELLTVLDRIWVQVSLVLVNGLVTVLFTLWLSPTYGVAGVLVASAFVTTVGWTWVFPLLTRSVLRRSPRGAP